MSFDIRLEDEHGIAVMVPPHEEGALVVVGGNFEADIQVTYNYSKHFKFKDLHGMKAADTIEKLRQAVSFLGTTRHENYWEPTPGNAGHCCAVLLRWAEAHPEAKWNVD